MKIVLAYAYGASNAGDHALTLGALDLVATVAPTADVAVGSRFSRQVEPTRATEDIRASFPEVEIVPSQFSGSRETAFKRALEKLAGGLLVSTALLFPRLVTKLESSNPAIHAIAESDIVLCNSGNLFYWNCHRKAPGRLVCPDSEITRRVGIPLGGDASFGLRSVQDNQAERTIAMTQEDVVYRFRLRTMALADEIGNVRAACRIMGIHHSTYYR